MRIAGDFNHTERTSSKSLELMGFHYPKPVSSTTEATIFSVILRFLKVKRTPKGEWEAEIWDPIRGCTYLLSGYDCPEKALVRAFHDAAFTLRSNRKAQLNFPQLLIQLHHQYSFLGEVVVGEYLKMEASRSIQNALRGNLYVDYVTQVFPGICLSNMDPGIYNLLGHMAVRRPKVLESNYYLQASGESLYDYPLKSLRQYRFPAFDDFSWESIVYKYDEKVFDSLSFHIDERDFPFRSRRRSSSRRRLDWGSSSSDSWGIWGNQRNAPWHVVNINDDDDDDEVFVAAKRVKRMRKEFNKFLKLYSNSMSCPPDLCATLAATFYGFQASQIWALGNPLDLLSSPSNTTLGFKDD
ncbi:ethylene-responsive transcription factor 13-like [Senna tora]|uniref:Ethylene-responsive transcription factor 13-like n=1 Tax=Senna tora TaxID=362788 RepID=A0A834XK12_9FABA|nr:ethylene-responsive transcription factor 13-like [Senna tora]